MRRMMIFAALLFAASLGAAQQSNGRSYADPVVTFGQPVQESFDSGDQLYLLFTPFKTSLSNISLANAFFSRCRIQVALADGSAAWGCAVYADAGNKPGALICGSTSSTGTVAGLNWRSLTGCQTPQLNTQYWAAQVTASSTQEPGTVDGTRVSSALCPGTSLHSYYSSAPLSSVSFPATAPAVSAQSFCYSETVDIDLGTNRDGLNYGAAYGIPFGPWGSDGTWYGGLYTPDVFVNFGTLTAGTTPTPTTLAAATLGQTVTWSTTADDPNGNMGASSYSLPVLVSPVSIGGKGYSGSGSVALTYTTNATHPGGYYGFALGASYTTLGAGYAWETDLPQTATGQYDQLGVTSADASDNAHWQLAGSGQSLEAFAECQSTSGGTTNSATGVPILTNTPYWIGELKATSGLANTISFYQLTTAGPIPVGTVSCNSGTGSHPAQNVLVGVGGSEPEVSGYHFWYQNIEISTTGAQVGP